MRSKNFEKRLAALEQACFGTDKLDSLHGQGVRIATKCMKVVCEHADLKLVSMRWRVRTGKLAFWRQVAMTLALELSGLSSYQVATLFNRTDHATVLHAKNVIDVPKNQKLLKELRGKIQS